MDSLIVLDELQLVVLVDQTEDGLNGMVSVGTLAKDVQSKIDFRVSPDFHLELPMFQNKIRQ